MTTLSRLNVDSIKATSFSNYFLLSLIVLVVQFFIIILPSVLSYSYLCIMLAVILFLDSLGGGELLVIMLFILIFFGSNKSLCSNRLETSV